MKCLPLLCALLFLGAGHENSGSVRILAYHSFLGDRNKYSFSLEELEKQCRNLIADGYSFVSFDDIRMGSVRGSRNILVTIDDGHRSVSEAYWKVLAPLKIKPLLAIYPAFIGADKYALTWQQLREMADHGATIASHGYDHLYVNEKLFRRDPGAFRREIYDSKSRLEERLHRPVDVFVYPFGARSAVTVRTVREAGYRYAMTVEGGPADISFKADAAFHEMPRYLLTRPDAPAIFASLKKPGSGGRDGMKGLATESGRGDIRPERNRIADRDSVSGISDESRDGEGDRSSSMKVDYRAQLSGVIMTAGFKTPVALGGHGVKDGALSGKTRLAALSGFHGDIKVRISGLMDLFRHTCLRFADSIQKKISLCRGRIENWLKSPGSVKNRGSRV